MFFKDAFRAQYYISALEYELHVAQSYLKRLAYFSKSLKILEAFATEIGEESDQILLPTLAYEIHKAKPLNGENSFDRYKSFFVTQVGYTLNALNIPDKYPFLFEMIDKIIQKGFQNLRTSLGRLDQDYLEILTKFNIPSDSLIISIKHLKTSDRHRDQKSLLFHFSNGTRVIYKPVDLQPDQLFREFIEQLNLPFPYDFPCLNILAKQGYGWIEFIDVLPCETKDEIGNFYRRSGALLAIANALNYTDGHCENIIATRSYPILLDGETFFQNYDPSLTKYRSILSTLLIERDDKRKRNRRSYSAFQASDLRFESFFTHAINDHTDEICVSFSGISNTTNHHRPFIGNTFYSSFEYLEEIIEGYYIGYDKITEKNNAIFSNSSWWQIVERISSRIILRNTATYFYLIRRLQQPECCKSRKIAEEMLRKKLKETPYTDYEVEDLLDLNIPYFYHFPNEKHLYDGKDRSYPNAYNGLGIDRLKDQLNNRSEKKKKRDCDLIRKHLIPQRVSQ